VRVALEAVTVVGADALVTIAHAWSGVVPGHAVITGPVLVTFTDSLGVEVSVVVADVALSWVTSGTAIADWVTWA